MSALQPSSPLFRAQLWADAAVAVYAVLPGSRLPGLQRRLQEAQAQGDLVACDHLWPGAGDDSPFLVRLKSGGGAFGDWLLGPVAAGLRDWGLLLRSAGTPVAVRAHLRAHGRAALPDGRAVELDWADPAVLRVLLPLATPQQLQAWFAPLSSLAWSEGSTWVHWRYAAQGMQACREEFAS